MRTIIFLLSLLVGLWAMSALAQEAAPEPSPETPAKSEDAGMRDFIPILGAEPEAERPAEPTDQPAEAGEAQAEEATAEEAQTEAAPTEEEQPAETAKISEAEKEKEGENILSSIGNYIELYGMLRLDIAYDSSRTNYGNYMRWVLPNKSYTQVTKDGFKYVNPGNGAELAISPRASRFGLKFKGTHVEKLDADLGGLVEIDFYGGDLQKARERGAIPRWRKVYLSLGWDFLEIRAGQDTDIFSPINPRTADMGTGQPMGNLGTRRPQLEFNFKPKVADDSRIWAQLSLGRSGALDGADYDVTTDSDGKVTIGDGNQDGDNSGVPMIQWRLAYEGPIWTERPFVIGGSGHFSQFKSRSRIWQSDLDPTKTTNHRINGYSVNLDLQMPILEWWVLRGEFFYGKNMSDVFGGVSQGVNMEALGRADGKAPQGVKGYGFWVDTTIQPWDIWALTVGYLNDTPDKDTLPEREVDGVRYMNHAPFINNEFHLGSGFSIALQYMYAMTGYKYIEDLTASQIEVRSYTAADNRFQSYFQYKF